MMPMGRITRPRRCFWAAKTHLAELRPVMCGGMGHGVAYDEAIFEVDADMVLVAEHRHRDLRDHPALGSVRRQMDRGHRLVTPDQGRLRLGARYPGSRGLSHAQH